MDDPQAIRLLEDLARYGSDYPDEVADDLTVRDLVNDLAESLEPDPSADAAGREARKIWGS